MKNDNIISFGMSYGGDRVILIHKADLQRQDPENIKFISVNIMDKRIDEGDSLDRFLKFVPVVPNDPKNQDASQLQIDLIKQKLSDDKLEQIDKFFK